MTVGVWHATVYAPRGSVVRHIATLAIRAHGWLVSDPRLGLLALHEQPELDLAPAAG